MPNENTQDIVVTLPASTIYVAGTVNGVPYTWTNTSGNNWSATVARASTGRYVCVLQLTNAATTVEQTIVLYYGLPLITDRTAEDVAKARRLTQAGVPGMTAAELAEYTSELKGCYGPSDLNRVGAAVAYIRGELHEVGINTTAQLRTNWTRGERFLASDEAAYIGQIRTLRSAVPGWPTTPAVPDTLQASDGWSRANDIEKGLLDMDDIVRGIPANFIYSNEIESGGF